MSEGAQIEAEIAELSKAIEAKRALLEASKGIVPESKDVVREVVRERVYSGETAPPAPPVAAAQTDDATDDSGSSDADSYLDSLDQESIAKVNHLVELVSSEGISKSIEAAKKEDPYILDAFHDLLVDKLHNELKSQGII